MDAAIKQTMEGKEWLIMLLLAFLWGGSFFFIGVAVKELPPLTIVTLRVSIAALTLWIVLWAMGHSIPRSASVWGSFLVVGLLNNVIPFSLIVWGQTHIASGLASILNATTPLFTILIAGLLLADERLSARKLLGVVIGFIGVVILINPFAQSDLPNNTLAQLAVLGAAISYSLGGVFGRRFKRMKVEPMMVATGQVTTAALFLAPIALMVDQPFELAMPSLSTWLAVITLAVCSTALAYVFYFRVLSSSGATNIALVTFLVPVTAIMLGVMFLDEQFKLEHLLGMLFIGLGLLVLDGRLMHTFQSRK